MSLIPIACLVLLICVVGIISILWTDLKGAPYVATPHKTARQMLVLAEVRPEDVVYDLGSGDGRLLWLAAQEFGAQAIDAYASVLFTLPGLPLLYAGQEIGEMQQPSLFEKSTIQWQQGDSALRTLYHDLIRLRKSTSCLTQGNFAHLPVASLSGSVGAFARWDESSAALIIANLRHKASEKIVISLTEEQQALFDTFRWTGYKSSDGSLDFQELYFDTIAGFNTRIYIGKK